MPSKLDQDLIQLSIKRKWDALLSALNTEELIETETLSYVLGEVIHYASNDGPKIIEKIITKLDLNSELTTKIIKFLLEDVKTDEKWSIINTICNLPVEKQPKNLDTLLYRAATSAKIELIEILCSRSKTALTKDGTSKALLRVKEVDYRDSGYTVETKAKAIKSLVAIAEPNIRPNNKSMARALSLAINTKNTALAKTIVTNETDLDIKDLDKQLLWLFDFLNRPINWEMVKVILDSNKVSCKTLFVVDGKVESEKNKEISSLIQTLITKFDTSEIYSQLDEKLAIACRDSEWAKIAKVLDAWPKYKAKPEINKILVGLFSYFYSHLSIIKYLAKEENADVFTGKIVSEKLLDLVNLKYLSADEIKARDNAIGILLDIPGVNAPNEEAMQKLLDWVINAPKIDLLDKIVKSNNCNLTKGHVQERFNIFRTTWYPDDQKPKIEKLLTQLINRLPDIKTKNEPKVELPKSSVTDLSSTSKNPSATAPAPTNQVSNSSSTGQQSKLPKTDLLQWQEASKARDVSAIKNLMKKSTISSQQTSALLLELSNIVIDLSVDELSIMSLLINLDVNSPSPAALAKAFEKLVKDYKINEIKAFPYSKLDEYFKKEIVKPSASIYDSNYSAEKAEIIIFLTTALNPITIKLPQVDPKTSKSSNETPAKDELEEWNAAIKAGNLAVIGNMIANSSKITAKETSHLLNHIAHNDKYSQRWKLMASLLKLSGPKQPDEDAMEEAFRKILLAMQKDLLRNFPINKLKPGTNLLAYINSINSSNSVLSTASTAEKEEIVTILKSLNSAKPNSANQGGSSTQMTQTTSTTTTSGTASSTTATQRSSKITNSNALSTTQTTQTTADNTTLRSTVKEYPSDQNIPKSDSASSEEFLTQRSSNTNGSAISNTQTTQTTTNNNTSSSAENPSDQHSSGSDNASSDETLSGTGPRPTPVTDPITLPLQDRKEACIAALDTILTGLKTKISALIPAYNTDAQKKAKALCVALETYKKTYADHLKNNTLSVEEAGKQFSKDCTEAINKAKTSWGEKLGLVDTLTNALKSIYNAIVKIFTKNQQRLFTLVKPAAPLKPIFEEAKSNMDLEIQNRGSINP